MRIWWKLGAAGVAVVCLGGCGGGHGSMMAGPNAMAGFGGMDPGAHAGLVSVEPAGGATGVPTSAVLTIHFDTPMAADMEHYVDLHEGDLGGPVVAITCAWTAEYEVLTCRPGAPLRPQTRYWIHLGGGMLGANGQPIDLGAYGPMYGGQWIQGGMMGQNHGGHPWSDLPGGWGHGGGYGMGFPFVTQ